MTKLEEKMKPNFHGSDERYTDSQFRLTNQPLLPLFKESDNTKSYDIYPTHPIEEDKIFLGYNSLVERIINHKLIKIDGYVGVRFDIVKNEIDTILKQKGVSVKWINSFYAQKTQGQIEDMIKPFLSTKDGLFGKICDLELKDFFEKTKLVTKEEYETLTIIYGVGSSLVESETRTKPIIVYFDLPKNEIQYRSRAKFIPNLFMEQLSPEQAYRMFYFVDWPILNKHKKTLASNIDVYVDDQRLNNIVWINGECLRANIKSMVKRNAIRTRPWFEPGKWGGEWLKNNINGIEQSEANYAWSLQLVAQENGIILESSRLMLEFSFDLLLYLENESFLGKQSARICNTEFPIHFQLLDTIAGENLSLHCHGGSDYMQEEFGEILAQDESYYILNTNHESQDNLVYLGFKPDVSSDQFRTACERSKEMKTELTVDKYIQSFSTKPHDFFYLPHGVIHSLGKNNLALEISSAPYIFTFRVYDWMRKDEKNKKRHVSLERAFENLNFNYSGDNVIKQLVNPLRLFESGKDWDIFILDTPHSIFSIHRIDFISKIEQSTLGEMSVFMLVEGEYVMVKTSNDESLKHFFYGETFIMPASVDCYQIINGGQKQCKLIKAFVKK